MILIIDNYDSFVYNLARYVQQLGQRTVVVRHDQLTLADIKKARPSHIILSPGPKAPQDAGICIPCVRAFSGTVPILGVCLGHQAIGAAFGARICRAKTPQHGMASTLSTFTPAHLFSGIHAPFTVGRYHSLVIDPATLPDSFVVSAYAEDGDIMAITHTTHPTFGVQFHPESILTPLGQQMMARFVATTRSYPS